MYRTLDSCVPNKITQLKLLNKRDVKGCQPSSDDAIKHMLNI